VTSGLAGSRRRGDPEIIGGMVSAMVAEPRCVACGAVTARIELVAPGQPPARWRRWSRKHRQAFRRYRDPTEHGRALLLQQQGVVLTRSSPAPGLPDHNRDGKPV